MKAFDQINRVFLLCLLFAGAIYYVYWDLGRNDRESHGAEENARQLPLFGSELSSIQAQCDWIWLLYGTSVRHEYYVTLRCSEPEVIHFAAKYHIQLAACFDIHDTEEQVRLFQSQHQFEPISSWDREGIEKLIKSIRYPLTAIPSKFADGDLFATEPNSVFQHIMLVYRRADNKLLIQIQN